MRKLSLALAALALATTATPASAEIDVIGIVYDVFEGCMDCFPQVECVNRPCQIIKIFP